AGEWQYVVSPPPDPGVWTLQTISHEEADWASLQGTWTFVGGVISQTDATADAFLQYLTPLPSTDYVVEADVRFPSGQDALTTMRAIIATNNQVLASGSGNSGDMVGDGCAAFGDGTGDGANVLMCVWADATAAPNPGFPVTMPQDEWH